MRECPTPEQMAAWAETNLEGTEREAVTQHLVACAQCRALMREVCATVDADQVTRAEQIARRVHAGQVDRTGRPYVEHLARVAASLGTDEERAVAWLHDVLEDTPETPASLAAAGVRLRLIRAVEHLTRGATEPYAAYIARVERCGDPVAIRVKMADLRDNQRPGHPSARPRYAAAWSQLAEALDA